MLARINAYMEKIMPLITPVSVVLGLLLSQWLTPYQGWSTALFAFMTFAGSLRSGFRDVAHVARHPLPLIAALVVLHVLMPLAAWGFGHVFFAKEPLILTGIVLAAAIPTGVTSLMWASIYRGHVVLMLSIILIDTLLAPFTVPATMQLLVGAKVSIDAWAMMKGLLFMIVLPSLLGMALHQLTGGRVHQRWSVRLAPFSKLAMAIVVALNGAVIAPYLRTPSLQLVGLAVFVLLLAALGYVLGWLVARMLRWDRGTSVVLTFGGGMRNISAGAVLAIAYFPAPTAIPVVLGMLFQQSLASLFGYGLHRRGVAGEAGRARSGAGSRDGD
ncbi:bile acid:sodium symporter family protein [Paenibacillus chartarius]|uniref:Bile acid:sodium symporter family protein n=1 Tax=Paenibacillus chartarius TaxID=747481 RepID=A0ABV6DV29_9BACL